MLNKYLLLPKTVMLSAQAEKGEQRTLYILVSSVLGEAPSLFYADMLDYKPHDLRRINTLRCKTQHNVRKAPKSSKLATFFDVHFLPLTCLHFPLIEVYKATCTKRCWVMVLQRRHFLTLWIRKRVTLYGKEAWKLQMRSRLLICWF